MKSQQYSILMYKTYQFLDGYNFETKDVRV